MRGRREYNARVLPLFTEPDDAEMGEKTLTEKLSAGGAWGSLTYVGAGLLPAPGDGSGPVSLIVPVQTTRP